ncbi:hypothetical protein CN345_04435 [Bacillus thuringiensis]|uniref:HBL/NHE enterotoxin family protein n=1 Tax=Bacillus thuringiensis TaxID=1428 RepID=UPI000BF2B38F|nr:HBL/NHE enterotoxin family protein [Bacillus thuringiensis]PEZ44436.1 hypothetical protein CN345_04435 [Bacillus thuringiensis]PGY62911.1 hypothetical protein COE09_03560 [Bacillus thuringiensis]
MKKYPYKVLAMASVLTIATLDLTPSIQAFAQEQAVTVNYKQAELEFDVPKTELQKQLSDIDNYYIAMQVYSQKITEEPNINLEKVELDSSDSTLRKDLSDHQQTARANAQFWNRTLKQDIIEINQGIISYDNQFQEYSKELEKAINAQDKETIKEIIIEGFMENTEDQKNTVDDLITKLEKFDDKLQKDNQAFQADGERLVTILVGKDSLIGILEKEILTYNKTIDQSLKYLISGAIATGVGIGVGGLAIGLAVLSGGTLVPVILGVGALATIAAGGYLAYANYDSMNTAKEGLKNATQQVSTARLAITTLQGAQSSVKNMHETIQEARKTLGKVSTQWGTTHAKYKTLIKDIDRMNPEQLKLLKTKLAISKNSWKDLRGWAEKIQVQLSGLKVEKQN